MRNIKILVLMVFLVMFSTVSFADQVKATGTLTIGGGTFTGGTAPTLTMGLSNNVTAVYEDGNVVKTQWYAIATSHLGGKQTYGTAQDVTNIYKLAVEKTPGTEASFDGMPADNTASEDWSSDVWKAL
jgi:hypothetical protein